MKISIKNMVCSRCILVVRQELEKMQLSPIYIQLGEAELKQELSNAQLNNLRERLAENGFELIGDRIAIMVEKVKNIIVQLIHGTDEIAIKTSFSSLIQNEFYIDYNYISSLFSNSEGITIEQYIIHQRIERVKELLIYNELTLSEISHKLGYSSVQHLSTQFKKVTDLTPSHFKTIEGPKRKPLDQV